MRLTLSMLMMLSLTVLGTGLVAAKSDDSPGSLLTGKAVYDGKRYAMLSPASLFDADNTPSVFRLGMVWDERYGDAMHFIVTFPIPEQVSMDDLKKSAETFEIKIDGKSKKLERVKNSIILRQESGAFSKTYDAEIRYVGSRQLVETMLKAGNVEFFLHVGLKKYKTTLKAKSKGKDHKEDREYTAINGLQRFHKAAWGGE